MHLNLELIFTILIHHNFSDDFEWKPHFFVLTKNKLFYSEVQRQDEAETEDDDGVSRMTAVTSVASK